MKFRTPVNIVKQVGLFNHSQRLLSIGSCFSDNVGKLLEMDGFNIQYDQFGTLFNPISIQKNIQNALENSIAQDLILTRDDRFYHYDLPSTYYGETKLDLVANIQAVQNQFRTGIKSANKLLLTFGTAWVYRLNNGGCIVANCHKMPQNEFQKELLDLDELKVVYRTLFDELKRRNSALEIILTVSPVRHKKDGLSENNLSKSILLLLTDFLVGLYDFVHYFPAYELVIDDLRDYRFYKEDMVHPNAQAIDYVYDRFQETYFSDITIEIAKLSRKLFRLKSHRSMGQVTKEALAKQEKYVLEIQTKIDQLKVEL